MVTTTYLQMRSKDERRPKSSTVDSRFRVVEATVKQWQFNRFLYQWVGASWAWRDKLSWSDEQWAEWAESDAVRTFPAYYDGSPAGYFELFTSPSNEIELAYLGLAPKFIGRGLGGTILSAAIERAWDLQPRRLWVHTCDLDHPHAIHNYQARGFTIYRIEHS